MTIFGGAFQPIAINSWHFLVLACLAIGVFRTLGYGVLRNSLLFILNAYFLVHYVDNWYSASVLFGLLVVSFGLGELHARFEERLPAFFLPGITAALWAFLFLVKDPNLFGSANPFHHLAPPRAVSDRTIQVIGISYLTFRAINYVNDAVILEDRKFLTFCNYMFFFPTLLLGPIERFDRFDEQYRVARTEARNDDILPTLHRIANGLIKKYVLYENLKVFGAFHAANPHQPVLPQLAEVALPLLWVGVLSQLALLYLDFSGYCDIVIGLARLMGFRTIENFNRPWLATNVQDFWNRWHMSLTHFIRDYAFVPIQRRIVAQAPQRWRFTLITCGYVFTMLLIALWHDTTWGYVVFGCLHALALVTLQLARHFVYPRIDRSKFGGLRRNPLTTLLARTATYVFVSLSMVFWYFGAGDSVQIFLMLLGVRA